MKTNIIEPMIYPIKNNALEVPMISPMTYIIDHPIQNNIINPTKTYMIKPMKDTLIIPKQHNMINPMKNRKKKKII